MDGGAVEGAHDRKHLDAAVVHRARVEAGAAAAAGGAPGLGAVAIAFALERPQHLPLIVVLTLLGSIYQLSQGTSKETER